VLFDLDGTLLDSELLWEAAQAQTMEYFGQTWTAQDQAHSIGGPLDRVVAHMVRRTGADPGHVARVLVGEIEHRAATVPAHWMPGARELLAQAHAAGVPTAIVSNSWRVLLDLLLTNVDHPVDVTVSSTEVQRPKPDPQPYLWACELLGADPRRTVVVEDSPTGAQAGLAAGCRVLAVGPVVAHMDGPRLRHVDSLAAVDLDSLRGDGVEDPQA
jgi:HAD superfamily hydrolase (TIGR01509 family)